MTLTFILVLAVQVIAAITIIVLVLLQQGKGADMGSAFGGGSAGSLFGATGAANFLSRTTKWAAVVFFVATAALAYMGRPSTSALEGSIMENVAPADRSVPVVPGAAPAPGADTTVPSVPVAPAPAAPAESSGTTPAN